MSIPEQEPEDLLGGYITIHRIIAGALFLAQLKNSIPHRIQRHAHQAFDPHLFPDPNPVTFYGPNRVCPFLSAQFLSNLGSSQFLADELYNPDFKGCKLGPLFFWVICHGI